CPDGRFTVPDGPLIPGATPPEVADTVLVADSWVKVQSGCVLGKGHVRAGQKGTVVRARWRRCSSSFGPMRLSATIDAATCSSMKGTVFFERTGRRQKFRAVRMGPTEVGPGTFALIQERIFA